MKFYKSQISNPVSRTSRGFTLVEMIVSLAIFSIVAVVAIGALVRVVSANRQAQSIQSSINSISFVIESLTREMRVAKNYHCQGGTNAPAPPDPNDNKLREQTCNLESNDDFVIAFNSSNVSTYAKTPNTGKECDLIYAYRFTNVSYVIKLEKAQQKSCDEQIRNEDYQSIMPDSVVITGYRFGVYNETATGAFPWAFIRIIGYAGKRGQDKSYFDVQTSVSARTI